MKNLVFLSVLFSSSAFGAITISSECHKITDEVDREYCHKKRMQLIKKEMSKDVASWKKELSPSVKVSKQKKLQTKLTEQQALVEMMMEEIKIYKNHQRMLNEAKVVVKRKKKKKKKDRRSDIEKALNIRL